MEAIVSKMLNLIYSYFEDLDLSLVTVSALADYTKSIHSIIFKRP